MYSGILNFTFDCADARAQATFWAAVTGWTAQERDATPGHVEYSVEPPAPGGPRLYFTTVPEPKTIKNRIHLDLLPQADDQPSGASWIVMADPEGNEFCLEG